MRSCSRRLMCQNPGLQRSATTNNYVEGLEMQFPKSKPKILLNEVLKHARQEGRHHIQLEPNYTTRYNGIICRLKLIEAVPCNFLQINERNDLSATRAHFTPYLALMLLPFSCLTQYHSRTNKFYAKVNKTTSQHNAFNTMWQIRL